jgi:tetratricopeptide (TPR) repeat protein
VRIQSYLLGGNLQKGSDLINEAIAKDIEAKTAPPQAYLTMLVQARSGLKDTAGATRALELLVQHYPSKDHWRSLINRLWARADLASRLQLDVFRLAFYAGVLEEATDYTEYVDFAQKAGFSAEALRAYDQGATAGQMGAGAQAEAHKKLRAKLVTESEQDRKTMVADTAAALKKPDGLALFNIGLNMVGMQQFDKGLELMEKAITKGLAKRPEDARLRLAVAYAQAGQADKARQTFATVSGPEGLDDLVRYGVGLSASLERFAAPPGSAGDLGLMQAVALVLPVVLLSGCATVVPRLNRSAYYIRQPTLRLPLFPTCPKARTTATAHLHGAGLLGGGNCSAALAYGVLDKLRQTTIQWEGRPRRLVDEVDVINSVSGGSYAAAYYGLFGDAFFTDFPGHFLNADFQTELWDHYVSMKGLSQLVGLSSNDRVDKLSHMIERRLLGKKTYADLLARHQRPLIVIHATDLNRGADFQFTQDQFDPLCAVLSTVPVARALAASCAVPILFGPVAIKNNSGRCGYIRPAGSSNRAPSRKTIPAPNAPFAARLILTPTSTPARLLAAPGFT